MRFDQPTQLSAERESIEQRSEHSDAMREIRWYHSELRYGEGAKAIAAVQLFSQGEEKQRNLP